MNFKYIFHLSVANTWAFSNLKYSRSILRSSSTKFSSLSDEKSVGFIGLGIMGAGMARRLVQGGHTLNVWNRTPEKCAEIKNEFVGAIKIFESPSEVIKNSKITFIMLSTPEDCEAVYHSHDGILDGVSEGKLIVDCATLQPSDMEKASDAVKTKGGAFLEAPVSGSKVPAEKGQLVFMTAGDKVVHDFAQPYLSLMGKSNYFVGEVGSATKMKLVVNSIMANMLASLAEGMKLSAAVDLDLNTLLQVISDGAMNNPMFNVKGPVYQPFSLVPYNRSQRNIYFLHLYS